MRKLVSLLPLVLCACDILLAPLAPRAASPDLVVPMRSPALVSSVYTAYPLEVPERIPQHPELSSGVAYADHYRVLRAVRVRRMNHIVVGSVEVETPDWASHPLHAAAWWWGEGGFVMRDIGALWKSRVLGIGPANSETSEARGVSPGGQVVGAASRGGRLQAFLYDRDGDRFVDLLGQPPQHPVYQEGLGGTAYFTGFGPCAAGAVGTSGALAVSALADSAALSVVGELQACRCAAQGCTFAAESVAVRWRVEGDRVTERALVVGGFTGSELRGSVAYAVNRRGAVVVQLSASDPALVALSDGPPFAAASVYGVDAPGDPACSPIAPLQAVAVGGSEGRAFGLDGRGAVLEQLLLPNTGHTATVVTDITADAALVVGAANGAAGLWRWACPKEVLSPGYVLHPVVAGDGALRIRQVSAVNPCGQLTAVGDGDRVYVLVPAGQSAPPLVCPL